MVVKLQLLFIICLISGFLLTIQFIFLQFIVHWSKPDSNPIWRTLYAVTTTAYKNDISLFLIDPYLLKSIKYGQQAMARRRTGRRKGTSNGKLPEDPDDEKMETYYDKSYCRILCQDQKVTQVAALNQLIDEYSIKRFNDELMDKGYTVIHLEEDLNQHNNKHIVTLRRRRLLHLLIIDEKLSSNDGHVVIVSILYDQLYDNWWRGGLELDATQVRLFFRQGIKSQDLMYRNIGTLFPKVIITATIIDGMVLGLPDDQTDDVFLTPERHLRFVECDLHRAKQFDDQHLTDHDRQSNRIFRIKVKRILSTAAFVLDQLAIPFWISSGTLLGYYRNCDVIHYSKDVDIGIRIEDFRPELIDELQMEGLALMNSFGMLNDSYELSFRNEDIKLDIFFFYTESSKYVWNGGTAHDTGFKYKYRFNKFSLCWSIFLDLKIRIPCDSTLEYIEANYGKEWMNPIREWDWRTSPPNVEPNGQWDLKEDPSVVQMFHFPPIF